MGMFKGFALRATGATLFLSFACLAQVSIKENQNQKVYEFTVEGVEQKQLKLNDLTYTSVKLKGVKNYDAILFEPGKPEIPVIRFSVDGEGPIRVETETTPQRSNPSHLLKPSFLSPEKMSGAVAYFLVDLAAYQKNSFEPSETYRIEELGSVRGVPRRLVTLYPYHYNAKTNEAFWYSRFRVTLETKALVWAGLPRRNVIPTLALVVGKSFERSPALQQFIQFKKKIGYRVRKLQMSQELETPVDIRTQLQQLLIDPQVGLEAVVLVGNAKEVPPYASPILGGALSPEEGVTDHYYSAIDTGNYDTDIGSPDIGVGRFSASNETELANIVSKTIRYEQGLFAEDQWLNRIAFIASDDENYFQVIEGTDNYVVENYTSRLGLTGTFPDALQVGGDLLYAVAHHATGEHALQRIREGRGIINYGGHGDWNLWVSPQLTQNDITTTLRNPSYIPIVFANACLTGGLVKESIAQTWQKHRYGSEIYWGSVSYTYWDEDDILQRAMYDAIYHEKKLEFSSFTQKALQAVWRHYEGEGRSKYYFETETTFGDPTVHIRTKVPTQAFLNGPENTKADSHHQQVEYQVVDKNAAVLSGARVVLLNQSGEVLAREISGFDGKVTFKVSPRSMYLISVSGDNLIMQTRRLTVE